MTLQAKGFGWSIGIHGLIALVAIMLQFSTAPQTKMMVIDFTFGNNSIPAVAEQDPQWQGKVLKQKGERLTQRLNKEIMEQKVPDPEPQQPSEVSLSDTDISRTALQTVPDANPTSSVTDFFQTAETAHTPAGASSSGSDNKSGTVEHSQVADTAHTPADSRSAGSGDKSGTVEHSQATYLKEHFAYIRDRITRNISYPPAARRMGWQGRVKIAFVIREDGGVTDVRVIDSCGFSVLDRNTVDTVMNVVPFPRPPAEAEIRMTINYRLE